MSSSTRQETKQPYVKPSVRRLSLVAEEVMAIGCKTPTGSGPFGGPGGTCVVPTECVSFLNVS